MLITTSDGAFGFKVSVVDERPSRYVRFRLRAVFPEGELGSGSAEFVRPDVVQFADLPTSNDPSLDPSANTAAQLLAHLKAIDQRCDDLLVHFGETFDFVTLRAYRYVDEVVVVYAIEDETLMQRLRSDHFDEVVDMLRYFVDSYTNRASS